ncbi:MAG: YggS family pyridoxal phosphate-dependent enzyme [Deltaproteobacteria bacterium]|nr:YggS family pyridoxal phosphate-dependent enzyme [Deltaproteobacteria bacterium]
MNNAVKTEKTIDSRIRVVKDRIKNAALSCGREPSSITLVAVSKTMPAHRVSQAIDAGISTFGENYIQEARAKVDELSRFGVSWHFIGHLQTNKVKYAVPRFDLIHSVDSEKLAREIDRQAKKLDKRQAILIQVNVGKEASKSGIDENGAEKLVRAAAAMPNLIVRGLMAIPPFFDDPETARPYFKALAGLRERIARTKISHQSGEKFMADLSMGMTGDFEAAITEGATMVRIGTAIFGQRK